MTSQTFGEAHFTQNPRERPCWAQAPEGQRPSIAPLETIVVSTISGLVSHATHLEQMRNWFNVQRPYLAIFIFSALSKCYLINLLDSVPFNSCTCSMFINSYKLFNALIVHFQFFFPCVLPRPNQHNTLLPWCCILHILNAFVVADGGARK